ncbi:phosphopantothenoylcysteine synthase/decarboxylase [Parvularcula bermudensis HTCC2503]|uniref:Coenzyme A biosynthesis bifunctional protein CoaBC n=1 Tax=Parvularcula bermudensis (strain ATCC BAA-594 / HTCC2503 / KCTC 12087) TaxID=314260 RepID=E0TF82_PARBH|nr:bifunctional phosphopantothenoylcysteine decarboxylase/phosphopantothenate synthase [Parvularcula bermudensis]ADM09000.1 phosphopantothenoylcysteine synthase/decarboxylase [Parvularcula bermudensis HTCC2503]
MTADMTGKRILLIIGGGIAAYKALYLIRLLKSRGAAVTGVLTQGGEAFVTPLSVGGLTGKICYTDLFDLTAEAEMGHIELSRAADLIVVAPATADLLAKAAHGHASDLASTIMSATDKPILFAPAMNVRMWTNAATQRNVSLLSGDGAFFVGPEEGDMACGEYGPGRMAEPEDIAAAIEGLLGGGDQAPDTRRALTAPDGHAHLPGGDLSGRTILITAGPTHEPLDPVRYLANRSSGKQGYALACACRDAGARVTLVSGPTALSPPSGVRFIGVETAREMEAACLEALPVDVGIFCAAVADYRPEIETAHKIKKERGGLSSIPLTENPDILKSVSRMSGEHRPTLVIGFAAETDDVIGHAEAKRLRKGCDWIVANDVSPGTDTMGGDNNTITILTDNGEETLPQMSKDDVARALVSRIVAAFDD